jgi:hypothetical protein
VTFKCPDKIAPNHLRVHAIPDEFFNATANKDFKFSGFLVDVLDAIQQQTGLTYSIIPRPELKIYDKPNANGSWDGTLINSLIKDEADLVGPSLIVSSVGEKVADFLVPILRSKLKVLFNPMFGLKQGVQYLALDDENLNLIKNSKIPMIQEIYKNIEAGRPNSIVPNKMAGVEKVLSGNYAFLVDSIFAKIFADKFPGKLEIAKQGVGSKVYLAFAVQRGSPLRRQLNMALLQLMENGVLWDLKKKHNLFHRWGQKANMTGSAPDQENVAFASDADEM